MSGISKARERILAISDEGSFSEIGGAVTLRSTDFCSSAEAMAGDGVITGFATVNGTPVCIYSQDRSVLGGSVGEMHAKKILSLYDYALKMGLPVIGMIDSSGLRLEEMTDALESFGSLYEMKTRASGAILQIDLLFGRTGGGMAIASGLSDFVLMERSAELFVNAPNTLAENTEEACNTASALFQAAECGNVDFIGTEEELFDYTKRLLKILPMNCQDLAVDVSSDDLNRMTSELSEESDIRTIAASVADQGAFIEVKKDYADSMVTGFILLDGMTVAVIGNQKPLISAEGLQKAVSFVRFADAFDIPLLTFTDASGFETTLGSEKAILKSAAEFVSVLSSATVPKLNVILREATGSAYVLMNSKAVGADMVYAVSGAKIGVMNGAMAAKIVGGGREPEKTAERFEKMQTAIMAAKRGYVDEIIEMPSLRKKILLAMEILSGKREKPIVKKRPGK